MSTRLIQRFHPKVWAAHALALMALVLLAATPQGFMISGKAAGKDRGPIPLVICSADAHTAPADAPDGRAQDKAPAGPSHAPVCVFAGHGLALSAGLAPLLPAVRAVSFARAEFAPRPTSVALPMAAPPPPSQAPPVHL